MSRPPAIPAADKVRIVLSILAGEMTCAEAHVELRVWKKSAEHHGVRLAPTRTSR